MIANIVIIKCDNLNKHLFLDRYYSIVITSYCMY